jgi:hypothetical protein
MWLLKNIIADGIRETRAVQEQVDLVERFVYGGTCCAGYNVHPFVPNVFDADYSVIFECDNCGATMAALGVDCGLLTVAISVRMDPAMRETENRWRVSAGLEARS